MFKKISPLVVCLLIGLISFVGGAYFGAQQMAKAFSDGVDKIGLHCGDWPEPFDRLLGKSADKPLCRTNHFDGRRN